MRDELAGGLMYHDRGFAGLPTEYLAVARSSEKGIELAVSGVGKLGDLGDQSAIEGPLSTPRALLGKKLAAIGIGKI